MAEIPEEAIRKAEAGTAPSSHDHEGVEAGDDTLRAHLEGPHGLDVPPDTSSSTQAGLHDRLHEETAAADE